MVTGNKQRSITSRPRYCEAAAGGSCHVRTGGAGTRAVGDGAVQKTGNSQLVLDRPYGLEFFPWAGLTGWAAPHPFDGRIGDNLARQGLEPIECCNSRILLPERGIGKTSRRYGRQRDDDIVPSYRDPHMAKFRESRPSEARPATKTPAGSCLDDRAACKATGWAGWEQ